MDANNSADKSRKELRRWQQTDPSGFVDYTFELQAEVRRLRDRVAQNSQKGPVGASGKCAPKCSAMR